MAEAQKAPGAAFLDFFRPSRNPQLSTTINYLNPLHYIMPTNPMEEPFEDPTERQKEQEARALEKRKREDAILATVDPGFYTDDFDPIKFALMSLGDNFTAENIETLLKQTNGQCNVVKSRLDTKVKENHDALVAGIKSVQEVALDLDRTSGMLKNGRQHLRMARTKVSEGSLEIISKARRKARYMLLASQLSMIQQVIDADKNMRSALDAGDFPLALTLCTRCQSQTDVIKLKGYACMTTFSSKLAESFESIETKMKASLQSLILSFDAAKFEKILISFKMLGKLDQVASSVFAAFEEVAKLASHDIVLQVAITKKDAGLVDLAPASMAANPIAAIDLKNLVGKAKPKDVPSLSPQDIEKNRVERLKKTPMKDLCKYLSEKEDYIPTLRKVLEKLTDILHIYHQISYWHTTRDEASARQFADVGEKLIHNRRRVWEAKTENLSNFELDTFIEVLTMVNKMIHIGDEFSGSPSDSLRNVISGNSRNFFDAFHNQKIAELQDIIRRESWKRISLQPNFSIKKMKEFDFTKSISFSSAGNPKFWDNFKNPFLDPNRNRGIVLPMADGGRNTRAVYDDDGDDENIPPELRADRIVDDDSDDEGQQGHGPHHGNSHASQAAQNGGSSGSLGNSLSSTQSLNAGARAAWVSRMPTAPYMCATSRHVLESIGRYINLMEVLSPISHNIMGRLIELVNYYVYCMFSIFASDTKAIEVFNAVNRNPTAPNAPDNDGVTTKMKTLLTELKAIYDPATNALNIVRDSAQSISIGVASTANASNTVLRVPKVSIKDMNSPPVLFGIRERIVAIESITLIHDTLRDMKPKIEELLPIQKRQDMLSFYAKTVESVPEIRLYVYRCLCRKFIKYDEVTALILRMRWDSNVMDAVGRSQFADLIIQDLRVLSSSINSLGSESIPHTVKPLIWDSTIRIIMSTLVDGYSRVQRWSSHGRSMMSLNLKEIEEELKKHVETRPIPFISYVDEYLRAFFLPDENELAKWRREHQNDYTQAQMNSIKLLRPGVR